MKTIDCDYLVIGSGLAGLAALANLGAILGQRAAARKVAGDAR